MPTKFGDLAKPVNDLFDDDFGEYQRADEAPHMSASLCHVASPGFENVLKS